MLRPLGAILFDLDGTLIDSADDLAASVNYARARLGLDPLEVRAVRAAIGDGVPKLIERTIPAEHDRGGAMRLFQAYYAEHLLDRTRPYRGVPELLSRLRGAGLGLAVCTNKPLAATEAILSGLGLARWFHAVLGGDSVAVKKPDPSMLRAALDRMGIAPQRAVVVGDSPNDVVAGRALSIPAIAVTYGIGEPRALARCRPERFASSVDELSRQLDGVLWTWSTGGR